MRTIHRFSIQLYVIIRKISLWVLQHFPEYSFIVLICILSLNGLSDYPMLLRFSENKKVFIIILLSHLVCPFLKPNQTPPSH